MGGDAPRWCPHLHLQPAAPRDQLVAQPFLKVEQTIRQSRRAPLSNQMVCRLIRGRYSGEFHGVPLDAQTLAMPVVNVQSHCYRLLAQTSVTV